MIPKPWPPASIARMFQSYFGVGLPKYWSPIFGFDVVGFDEYLKTPDGVSTADYIKKTYGHEAMILVKGLLS